jgi:thioredoxin reductase
MSKEELVELWQKIVTDANLPVQTGIMVEGINPDGPVWRLETTKGPIRAANVLLGLGRRGTPRKLEVPGEEQTKVHYALVEPAIFKDKHVLVVGGGNSAVETAISLADFEGCASVSISYRRGAFARCRIENRQRIDALIAAGKVKPYLPSEVVSINEKDVVLKDDAKQTTTIPNDGVIIQVGGTAPSEMLQKLGIEVVTKFAEA